LTTTVMSLSNNGYCPLVREVNECSSRAFSFTKTHHCFRMTVMSFLFVGHGVLCVTLQWWLYPRKCPNWDICQHQA